MHKDPEVTQEGASVKASVTHLQSHPRRKGYRTPAANTMKMAAHLTLFISHTLTDTPAVIASLESDRKAPSKEHVQ